MTLLYGMFQKQVSTYCFHEVVETNRKRIAPKASIDPTFQYEVDDETQKRQKRLEKNREIAKNCRKRKKEKKEALEEEVDSFCYFKQ